MKLRGGAARVSKIIRHVFGLAALRPRTAGGNRRGDCQTPYAGHDFRPAYLDALSGLRAFGWPTILALAATATADVVADIERQPETGR